jgi:hypothetical protein
MSVVNGPISGLGASRRRSPLCSLYGSAFRLNVIVAAPVA